MRRPTFSILTDSEENMNLAIKEFIEISLEEGIIDEQFLKDIEDDEKRKQIIEC